MPVKEKAADAAGVTGSGGRADPWGGRRHRPPTRYARKTDEIKRAIRTQQSEREYKIMVIDTLDLYPELRQDFQQRYDEILKYVSSGSATATEHITKVDQLQEEVTDAYIKSTGGDYGRIMGDAGRIIVALTAEDHEEDRQACRGYYSYLAEHFKPLANTKEGRKWFTLSVKHLRLTDNIPADAYKYICSRVNVQMKALEYSKLDKDPLLSQVREKVAEWYGEEWINIPEEQSDAVEEEIKQISEISLSGNFALMLNNPVFNEIIKISKRDYFEYAEKAQYINYDIAAGFEIEKFNEIMGELSITAKKILHAGFLGLTQNNYYKTNSVNPKVVISLEAYAEACGYTLKARQMQTKEEQEAENKRAKNRLKDFKKIISRDLKDIRHVTWYKQIDKGDAAGDTDLYGIISSFHIRGDDIIMNFDIDAAEFLVKSQLMQFPLVLLKIDNRNPNAYAIGYKIALHNSIDNNYIHGTNNTLSVKSLLKSAEQIITIDELYENGQRNWKEKIKKRLESSLDTLVKIGYLSKWEYRDTKTGKVYTKKQADNFTWESYILLMVDWITAKDTDQEERRARIAVRIEEREKEATPVKKKSSKSAKKRQDTRTQKDAAK